MDILFKNATVVTMNPEEPVLHNVDVGITGRKISYISSENKVLEEKPKRTINCENKVIMPGLYNSHSHAGMTMFRGYANDRNLEDWLFNYIFPAESKWTPDLLKTGVTLAAAEMIASGTISINDMYSLMDTTAIVADEVGILANISNGIITFDEDSYDFYKDHVYVQTKNAMDMYHNKGDGRIKIDASIHGVYTSFSKAWEQVLDFAAKNKLGLHVHLSETKTEHEGTIEKYGKTPAKVFYEHGIFDLPTFAAHGVWLTDEDMDILAEKNVSLAHCPISNLKLASGLACVTKMIKKGINVAIGTDGVSSNNSHDIFEELKMASLLQKYNDNDPTSMPALETLKLATTNGAKAAGRENESGMIKVGFDADMILLDFDNPRQTVCYDPVISIVYSVSGRDVEMTICRGKVLYEKGEYKTIDIEKTLYEARLAQKVFIC